MSIAAPNPCDEWERLLKTNFINKLLKLGRIGVVDNDLQSNKYLSSKAEQSSNNWDDNASGEDWVLVRGVASSVSTRSGCWNG